MVLPLISTLCVHEPPLEVVHVLLLVKYFGEELYLVEFVVMYLLFLKFHFFTSSLASEVTVTIGSG